MTIPIQTPRVQYVGNGVTTTFAFPFRVFDPADLFVQVAGIPQDGTYAASGIGDATGSITFNQAPVAQLGPPRPGELPPCDTPLALTVAACAVQTALSFLDGEAEPSALGAELQFGSDAPLPARIEVPPHVACACGALGDAPDAQRLVPSPGDVPRAELLE